MNIYSIYKLNQALSCILTQKTTSKTTWKYLYLVLGFKLNLFWSPETIYISDLQVIFLFSFISKYRYFCAPCTLFWLESQTTKGLSNSNPLNLSTSSSLSCLKWMMTVFWMVLANLWISSSFSADLEMTIRHWTCQWRKNSQSASGKMKKMHMLSI